MEANNVDTTNMNVSKSADYDILQSDIPIVKEIQQMREAKVITRKNIDNYQKLLTEDQRLMQEKKVVKSSLEKVVIELQCKLNEENHYSNETRAEIDKMRLMSNQIGEHLVRNNTLLQQCLQNKIDLTELMEKQKVSINENLKKKVQVYEDKQIKKAEVIEIINNQRKAFKDNIEVLENQCLEKLQQINSYTNQLENLNRLYEELHQNSEDCYVTINQLKKSNEDSKYLLHDKQKRSKEMLHKIEEEQNSFRESSEKVYNALDECNLAMQKMELEIESVERAIAHQKAYNNDLQEKISQNTLTDLPTDIKLLETDENERQVKYEEDVKQRNDVLSLKLKKKEDMEIKKTEAISSLKDIEQGLPKCEQLIKELDFKTADTQSTQDELQQRTDKILSECLMYSEQISSLECDINKIFSKINEVQQNNKLYEQETKQLVNNVSDEIGEIALKIDGCKEEKQCKRAAIIEEINSIKSNFDSDTAKQTEEFESIQRQLENDIQQMDIKFRDFRNSQMLQQEELEQLSKECDITKIQIKNLKSVLSTNITPKSKPLAKTSQDFVLPILPKEKSFDELSNCSSDSAGFMYRNLVAEKKRRRQESRKQAKKSRRSHTDSLNK